MKALGVQVKANEPSQETQHKKDKNKSQHTKSDRTDGCACGVRDLLQGTNGFSLLEYGIMHSKITLP